MIDTHDLRRTKRAARRSFTLVELLVAIMIIVILASIILFSMSGVAEKGREERTRSQIARLNALLAERWESYMTRRVPVPSPVTAKARLDALRELIRMELPDRKTDVDDGPVELPTRPALSRAYQKLAGGGWTDEYQGAECLYMIVSRIQDGYSTGLDFFSEKEIGDVDKDGVPEILDGWGNPIRFLRWPAGFESLLQDLDPANGTDVFDYVHVYGDNPILYPLIVSAGRDGQFNIMFDQTSAISYATTSPKNDPYAYPMGSVLDAALDGHLDNLHNHLIETN